MSAEISTATVSTTANTTTLSKHDDIWHDTGSDFFGCNVGGGNLETIKCTSIKDAFDAVSDYYEKPLPVPTHTLDTVVHTLQVLPVKPLAKKAKHLYKQPPPKKCTYDEEYDEDYYDED